jgi:uncharacterized RDD family membrane protein YckC
MRYFYADADRKTVGPVSDRDVARMIREGVLQPDSPLMVEGGTAWQTVGTLVRQPSTFAGDYSPPARNECRHCHAGISKDAKWCPSCDRSTREHVTAKLASPLKRFFAVAIDSVVPAFGTGMSIRLGIDVGLAASGVVRTIAVIAWAVWSMMLFSNGMTPGKWMLGLYVIDESGDTAGLFRMLIREYVCKPLVTLPFMLGIAWVLVDKNNQGWHDKLVKTYVVED